MSKIALSPNASGTGTFTVAAPNTNTDYTLTLPEGTGTVVANNVNSAIVSGTAVASTSGTSIDFTGIPSWVKRITVMFDSVSTNGTSNPLIQLGDSGGIETTGYFSMAGFTTTSATANGLNYTSGFGVGSANAANSIAAQFILSNISGNIWVITGTYAQNTSGSGYVAGRKTLSDTLTQVRITTVNGTDTFDAGTINILYE
jgi:hypothetical protein